MKTKFLFIVILAITFTSCSSSGWSCKKRYVINEKQTFNKNVKINS